jgi:DNA-binding SARP family transcriptional activator/ABC-type glycerol-3-phosphate transport system substrate-binding protein
MRVRFHLLGTLQVSVADGRGAPLGGFRQRMVVAVLLLHAGQQVTADHLIDAVWGDEPPATARKTLQVYVSRLRRALLPGDITAVPGGYVLHADPAQIDAVRFERAAEEGRSLIEDDPERAATVLREALALWRGAPWGDLRDQPALWSDAERLRELKLVVLEDRLTADLASGRAHLVTGELRALVSDHPARERLRGLLMTALVQDERGAEALQVFAAGRRWLVDELGTEPGPGLQELHRRILEQDPTLHATSAPDRTGVVRPAPPNPYKGLQPFAEGDAGRFFGREGLVRELLERVATSSSVVLVGPSGSGKSSVVLAGLVPALRAERVDGSPAWRIALMRPGARPLLQLELALDRVAPDGSVGSVVRRDDGLDLVRAVARCLPEDDGRLLLVIDQFEELFLQAPEVERDRFIRDLAEVVEDPGSRLTVVAVLRADLLGHPMTHPRLGPLVADGVLPVLPLAPAELEAACVVPAARVGVTVEPELAAELIAEVAGRPGALPLFQYTMTELFDRRDGDTISAHDHRRLGGLSGVVARRAEETYDALDEGAQEACRQLFLRLVTLGDEGEVARRRVLRRTLDAPSSDVVIERFASARLLALDLDSAANGPTVEVAHEALFRAWPRLRSWIDDAQDDLRVRRWLTAATEEWEASGRSDGYLLSGARLDIAQAWRDQSTVTATTSEGDYLDASLAARERSQAEQQVRQQRELDLERRAAGRLRALVTVLTVASVVALSLGVVAITQWGRAEERADEARAATELQRARQLASTAIANRAVDPELSVLLALHATNIAAQAGSTVPSDIVESLHWSLQARRVPFPGDRPVTVVDGPQGPQGIFELPLDELFRLARGDVTRSLSPEECADHLSATACPTLPRELPDDADGAEPATVQERTDRPLAGTRVTLMNELGEMGVAFRAFTARTGIAVEDTTPANITPVIERGLASHTPPDIAVLPYPSIVPTYVGEGELIDIATYLDLGELRRELSPYLVSLGTVADDGAWPAEHGSVFALPVRVANKSTVWYSIPRFEEGGYAVPSDYDELARLTERIVADGLTPWCHGEGSEEASGWPGTDLVENLLLHTSLDSYDAWVRHDIGFDSPPLHDAFERMGRLLLRPGHVVGGHAAAATLQFPAAAAPLFDDPPGCVLYPQASFASSWLPFGAEPGRDVGVFPFPPVTPGQDRLVLGAGDFAMAFTDRPEVREVMRYMVSEEFGREWARDGSGHGATFMSPRADFPLDAYVTCSTEEEETCTPDPVRAALAPPLHAALREDRFRFDGSDLLPHEMGLEPMWTAMVDFVGTGPAAIDRILTELEAEWVEREREAAG